jgi:hypothetical protein
MKKRKEVGNMFMKSNKPRTNTKPSNDDQTFKNNNQQQQYNSDPNLHLPRLNFNNNSNNSNYKIDAISERNYYNNYNNNNKNDQYFTSITNRY